MKTSRPPPEPLARLATGSAIARRNNVVRTRRRVIGPKGSMALSGCWGISKFHLVAPTRKRWPYVAREHHWLGPEGDAVHAMRTRSGRIAIPDGTRRRARFVFPCDKNSH